MKLLKQFAILAGSLFIALGSTLSVASDWNEFTTPQGVASLVGVTGSVLLAWLGESPRKPRV